MIYCFYPGCSYHSSAGYKESTEAVTKKLGIELMELPDWNCCGATVMHGESRFKATALVARNFALAAKYGFSEIVTGCNACYTTLRKAADTLNRETDYRDRINEFLHAEGLVVTDDIKVRHLADVFVNDVSDELWRKNRRAGYDALNIAVYYGCQLTRPWNDLDSAETPEMLDKFFTLLGCNVVDHSAKTLCCGASLAVPYADECKGLTTRLIREITKKGGNIVTTICPLCQFNLDNGQKAIDAPDIPVTFFTQIVGLVMGISPSALGLNKLLISPQKVMNRS